MRGISIILITFCIGRVAIRANSVEKVIDHFDLSEMTTIIEHDTVSFQKLKFENKVSFEQSLHLAINSIFNDSSDIESPLALMIEDSFFEKKKKIEDPVPLIVRTNAQNKLKTFLNQVTTTLGLFDSRSKNPFCFPPEKGELVRNYWIYCLKIPEYSDHLYWILVSRSDKHIVYNYGFN